MQEKIDQIKKYCAACEQTKPIKLFYRLATSNDGYTARCKRCMIDKIKIFKGESKTKAKLSHLRSHDEIIDLRGITREDIRQSYLLIQSLGYNICEDIHLQFCEKYNLPPKKKKYIRPRLSTKESFGFC